MDRRRRAARTVALMSLFTMTDTQTDVPIASFDGDGSDLISLIVGIDPVQAGSGDPSPDNVRPISGWTEAKVTRTGKNLNPNQGNQFTTYNASAFYLKAGTYTFSTSDGTALGSNNAIYFQLLDKNNNVITEGNMASPDLTLSSARTFYFGGQSKSSFSFDLLVDAYVKIGFNNALPSETYSIQLELGPAATAYEHYQGETYSITFPSSAGTVYGGTLDVTTGKLTVDRANIASYNGETLTGRWISDRDVYSAGTTPTIGAQVVYELATPIVYDLTPTQVTTLIGTNNIWADTGDIKYIEYNI